MKTYRVRDWNKHFENDRSRGRDKCSFVCVPNKQHGLGFCRIVSELDGASIYGIWQMILGACSQQNKPREGWLTSNGKADGKPWGTADLALKFRRPIEEIERALIVLTSPDIDWLLTVESPSSHHAVTAQSPTGDNDLSINALSPSHLPITAHSPPTHLERRERSEEKEVNERGTAHALDGSIPTWDEVKAEAAMRNVPEASAKKFFDHHQNNSLWINQFGRLINWREKLTTWAVKDREISSIAETKKRNPDAPTMTAVKDLLLEKWGDDPRWQNWAVSFYNFWSDPKRDWKHKDGKKIDWQIELSKQVTRWKSDSEN